MGRMVCLGARRTESPLKFYNQRFSGGAQGAFNGGWSLPELDLDCFTLHPKLPKIISPYLPKACITDSLNGNLSDLQAAFHGSFVKKDDRAFVGWKRLSNQ